VALALVLSILLFPGCSDDDPTCPEPAQGVGLSSTVLAPHPRPSSYVRLFSPGPLDLFITASHGHVLRRHLFTWKRYDTGIASWIYGMWGPSASDVFAVGGYGAISRFDGSSWRTMDSGTNEHLQAIHGTAADDVWAVCRGKVIHFDGTGWSAVTDSMIRADRDHEDIWCAPTGEVFVIANGFDSRGVLTYDGVSTWTEQKVSDYSMLRIWGADPDNVWSADDNGRIYQFDGTAWTHVHTMPRDVTSIHGTAANDVWVSSGRDLYTGGYTGDIAHFDGTGWRSVAPPGTNAAYTDVQAIDSHEIYTIANTSLMLGWDSGRWRMLNDVFVTHESFGAIWGSATSNLWLLDTGYAAWHTDGSNWEGDYAGTTQELNAMWGAAENDIYAVGDGGVIVHYDGVRWSGVAHGLGSVDLYDIWGTASDDIWVACVSLRQIWHYDGTGWTIEDVWSTMPGHAVSLWGSARDNYYAVVGDRFRGGGVFHYDGTGWQQVSLDGHIPVKVHGVSASEVYFLTGEGSASGNTSLIRYTPLEHSTSVTELGASMTELWALGPNNVFVAGSQEQELIVGHFDGSRVVTHKPAADVYVRDIWGTGSDTLYLCANRGTLIRVTKN
jgi:hypothetical protein